MSKKKLLLNWIKIKLIIKSIDNLQYHNNKETSCLKGKFFLLFFCFASELYFN